MYFSIFCYVVILLTILLLFRKKKNKNSTIINPNQFVLFPNTNNYSPSSKKISIMTYNILVQKYVKSKKLHYQYRSSLSLTTRINKILFEIESLDPDIICLQEVIKENLEKYIKSGLDKYNILSAENTGSNFLNTIGYKKDKFKFIFEKSLNLDFSKFDFIDNMLFGNRGIFKVILERNNQLFVIYNVHYPWRPQFEYHKCVITNFIFEDILREHYDSNHIIFIAGDFNSLPESYVLKLFYNDFQRDLFKINQKIFKSQVLADYFEEILINSEKINRVFKLQSVYDNYKNHLKHKEEIQDKENYVTNHPEFTNYTECFCGNIDYIFFSKRLQPFKILKLPSITEAREEVFFPSPKFPSDHIKLYSEFLYS